MVDRRGIERQSGKTQNRPELSTQLIDVRRGAALEFLGALGGLSSEKVEAIGRSYVRIAHRGPGDSLN